MKRFILFFLLICQISLGEEKIITIAKVNDTIVTNIDINNEISFLKTLFKTNEELQNQALNNIIDGIIKNEEVKKNSISVNEELIEKEYKNFFEKAKQNNVDLSEKMSKILYKKIKLDIEWNILISNLYGWKTNINLSEINDLISDKNIAKMENNTPLEKEKLIELEKNKKFNIYSLNHLNEKKRTALIKIY